MLYFQVRHDSKIIGQGTIEPPFQIGRQNKDETDLVPVCVSEHGEVRRLVVVRIVEVNFPRRAVNVNVENGRIVIESLVPPQQCEIRTGSQSAPASESTQAEDDVTLVFNNGITVQLQQTEFQSPSGTAGQDDEGLYVSLAQLKYQDSRGAVEQSLMELAPEVQSNAVNLIKSTLQLTNETPGSPRFFSAVARTVRNLIDVDRVTILQYNEEEWIPAREFENAREVTAGRRFSRSLLNRVLESRETQIFEPSGNINVSIVDLQRAIASPIFDDHGEVQAILYADKPLGFHDRPIGLLQATLLDVVANAISNSMLRQREAEFRTTTGQFFSKSVLDRLSQQKDLLEGRDAEVSILFCDIRGFSRIAHQVGPTETIHWINDVLTSLSECILEQDGVVVDYVGDAVMAMFGAPEPQSDHATRACRAALAMLGRIPELNCRHQALTTDFNLGIGVNSGIARVGNTGSRIKFKYGPLGSTVNMASRVESITKKFGVTCIFTESTQALLSEAFQSRRLSRIRVVGIDDPVDIYQLMPTDKEDADQLRTSYEQALQLFENQNLPEAVAQFASIIRRWSDDRPSQLMLRRCVDAMNTSQPFESVFNMLEK